MDNLGSRMKSYEQVSRHYFPRNSYIMLRVDGKAFHTYTRGLDKPFDYGFMEDMRKTACTLAEEVDGFCFGYTQSDEISLVFTDLQSTNTQPWFGNCQNKIESVSASIATSQFNKLRSVGLGTTETAQFDARAWVIPDAMEVHNYFVWRQKDWERNSLQMFARSLHSHKQLVGKNRAELHEMIHEKGENWAELDGYCKNGTAITKVGSKVVEEPAPTFTAGLFYILSRLPTYQAQRIDFDLPELWAERN